MSTRADQSRRKKKAVSKSVAQQHTIPPASHSSAGTSSAHDQERSQSTPVDADIIEHLLPFIGSDHIDDHDDEGPYSTHASNTESSASIDQIGIIRCHKGGLDFSSGIVTDCIRDLILSRVNHFWPRFSEIPDDVKSVMFKDFLSKFKWKPDTSEAYIRKIWEQKASIKYKEMVHGMKKSRKKAKGIAQEIYGQFELYWEREDVKARAKKNAANRAQNKRLHIGGSRSFADYQQDLSKEYRRNATAWDVYLRTHRFESSQGSSEWVDDAASEFNDKHAAMIQGMKEKGITITPEVQEQIFVDLSDSMKTRRDRIPNVGNIPVRQSSERGSSYIAIQTQAQTHMQTQLEEMARQYAEQLKKHDEEMTIQREITRKHEEEMAQQKRELQSLHEMFNRQFGSSAPPPQQ